MHIGCSERYCICVLSFIYIHICKRDISNSLIVESHTLSLIICHICGGIVMHSIILCTEKSTETVNSTALFNVRTYEDAEDSHEAFSCWTPPSAGKLLPSALFLFLVWRRRTAPSFPDCRFLIGKVGRVCLQLYPSLSVSEKDKELLRAYNNLLILMSRRTIWASLPLAALIIHACFNIYTCLEARPKPKVALRTGDGIHRTAGYG